MEHCSDLGQTIIRPSDQIFNIIVKPWLLFLIIIITCANKLLFSHLLMNLLKIVASTISPVNVDFKCIFVFIKSDL